MSHNHLQRILVIDGKPEIQNQFLNIFAAPGSMESRRFEIVSAFSRAEGLDCLKKALAENRPFPIAFVDAGVPPGWEGIETARRLWKEDAALQVVICSAFAEFSPDALLNEPGGADNLMILRKPLDKPAVMLAACCLAEKSRLALEVKNQQENLKISVQERTKELEQSLARDTTERLSLEAQLIQSQKMESVGRLAGGIAHDFNNLLTVISGHASLLLARESLPTQLVHPLTEINKASQRAAELTRQLLTFSRKQVMQPQVMDLNDAVKNITKMLRRVLGEDIGLEFTPAGELPPIKADIGMIEQVLLNLAVNSRDAMPKGGQLRINTSAVVIGPGDVQKNSEARPGRFVCLTFADNGCGIPPENISRIFEPFFTTKELDRGTGLGLATVYGIVKQHQGWIEASSEPGKGATFQIFIPASVDATPQAQGSTAGDKKVIGGTETILVVEDEGPLLELMRHILQSHGYKVLGCATGREALTIWGEQRQKIELLLTDIVLPDGMTGPELAEILIPGKSSLKVIFTSGYESGALIQSMKIPEGSNWIQKPFHARKLVEAVYDCLQKK
jgi:signal transduction histidine kinase/ActR/RegA family two-component response regulator